MKTFHRILVREWRRFVARRPGRLDAEIARQRAALVRLREQMDSQFPTNPGDCCASCRYGDAYTSVADRFERAGAWLSILLRKRGGFRDYRLARAIEMSAWP